MERNRSSTAPPGRKTTRAHAVTAVAGEPAKGLPQTPSYTTITPPAPDLIAKATDRTPPEGGSGAEEERSTTFRSGVEEAHTTTTSCLLLAAQAAEEAVRRIPHLSPAAKVAPPRRLGPPPRRPGSFAKGRSDGEPRRHLHRQPPRLTYLWWRLVEGGWRGWRRRGKP